ncbi:MAG: hypothetical protein FJ272_22175, partial [Planctomycetes bacterium]|nr:hypothetical protein [Planctomycetota bacterium]
MQGAPPADQMANATYRVEPSKLPDLAAQMAKLQPYDGPDQDSTGQVTLRIDVPTEAVPLPMVSGGVPFPKGKLFRAERVRVADAAGREMPCQIEVLARWHADHSIKMLLVTVPGSSASAQMTLVFGPDVLRQAIGGSPSLILDTKSAALEATDGEGRTYRGRVLSAQTERFGPLVSVTAVRGEMRSDDGKRLGRYVTRYTAFRGSSLVHIAHCWINDGPEAIRAVRSAAFDILAKPSAPEPTMTQVRTGKAWAVGTGDQPVPASEPSAPLCHTGLLAKRLAVRDFAENHPMALTATERGYRVWLWPETVRGVLLPQGFARQWEFLFDTASESLTRPFRTQSLPVLRADAQWMCASGVFEFLLPPDPQTFSIFEQRVGSMPTLGRFAWQEKERGNLFGVFNYGDAPGDGGWANLESMADHELFLHWMRTTGREHFDVARLAAEHYRDVDIHHGAGFAHTHCNNHTSSGEGWSHSWIQGVRDLYLLLGDFRALEVLHEVGECLLTKDIGWATGRDWTRAIDDLV